MKKCLPLAPLGSGFGTDPPLENDQKFREGGSVENYSDCKKHVRTGAKIFAPVRTKTNIFA